MIKIVQQSNLLFSITMNNQVIEYDLTHFQALSALDSYKAAEAWAIV